MQLERLIDYCQAVSLGQKTAKEAGNTFVSVKGTGSWDGGSIRARTVWELEQGRRYRPEQPRAWVGTLICCRLLWVNQEPDIL